MTTIPLENGFFERGNTKSDSEFHAFKCELEINQKTATLPGFFIQAYLQRPISQL